MKTFPDIPRARRARRMPGREARQPRHTHARHTENCTQTEHTRRARGRAPHARQIGFAADGDAPHARLRHASHAPRARVARAHTRDGVTLGTHATEMLRQHICSRSRHHSYAAGVSTSSTHQDQRKVGSLSLLPLTFALALAKLFGHRLGRHDRVDRAEDDGPRRPRLVDYRHLCGIWKRRPARSDQNSAPSGLDQSQHQRMPRGQLQGSVEGRWASLSQLAWHAGTLAGIRERLQRLAGQN